MRGIRAGDAETGMNIKSKLARLEQKAAKLKQRETEERKEIERRVLSLFIQTLSISEAAAKMLLDEYPLSIPNRTATLEERMNFAVNRLRREAQRRLGLTISYEDALEKCGEHALKKYGETSTEMTAYLAEQQRNLEEQKLEIVDGRA